MSVYSIVRSVTATPNTINLNSNTKIDVLFDSAAQGGVSDILTVLVNEEIIFNEVVWYPCFTEPIGHISIMYTPPVAKIYNIRARPTHDVHGKSTTLTVTQAPIPPKPPIHKISELTIKKFEILKGLTEGNHYYRILHAMRNKQKQKIEAMRPKL